MPWKQKNKKEKVVTVSDQTGSPILLVKRLLFFEQLSTISIDWNRNLLVVLPNRVFYGNCVVCRIGVGLSSKKAKEFCHFNYAKNGTAFSLASLFIYKIVKFGRERV